MIMKFVLKADGTYEASNTKGHYSFDSATNAITWLDGPHQKVITKTQIGKRENGAPKNRVRSKQPLLRMLHAETEIEMRMHVSRWRQLEAPKTLYIKFCEAVMSQETKPIAITAAEAPVRVKTSVYPEPLASRMMGREKRPLSDLFGLTNFGVNLTRLAPQCCLCPSSRPHQARRVYLHSPGTADAPH